MRVVALRMIVAATLIVSLTMFWVYLLFFTEISMLGLSGIALLILLTLSTATAWTATGMPGRDGDEEEGQRDE